MAKVANRYLNVFFLYAVTWIIVGFLCGSAFGFAFGLFITADAAPC
jgi:hypothetical protein